MTLDIYQVDAFASGLFSGNPAAVCPVEEWPKESLMQAIASENNLAETAFFAKENDAYRIRWFTPAVEVDLCGHATLASAYVLFNFLESGMDRVDFHSRSGPLTVTRESDMLQLNFPADDLTPTKLPHELRSAINLTPNEVYKGKTDYLLIFDREEGIRSIRPDFGLLARSGGRGVIVSAPGASVDFVSRFFAPQSGIDEDPVTGSAHTSLTPYWSKKLNKNRLIARQLSSRGGELICEMQDGRVLIGGKGVLYMQGKIFV